MNSIENQSYKNIQLIWIDGESVDGTKEYLMDRAKKYPDSIFISEFDNGIYDALNKGLKHATGDIVGFLHADDLLENRQVLSDIANEFKNSNVDVVYGDLVYVDKNNINLFFRKWKSEVFQIKNLKYGWMPPHPTVYARQRIIKKIGFFNTKYQISSDYDYMLRLFTIDNIVAAYIPKVLVKMRVGGESNKSIKNIIKKILEDVEIVRKNKIGNILTIFFKNILKIKQLLIIEKWLT